MAYTSKADQKRVSDAYYQAHAEEIKASNRLWKKNNPTKVYLNSVRRRARARNLKFDLDLEWFEQRLTKGVCEVTNLFFIDSGKPMAPFKPSVDRIDPKRGYTKNNCKMVVWIYNACKGDNLHEDVMMMARALCTQS